MRITLHLAIQKAKVLSPFFY